MAPLSKNSTTHWLTGLSCAAALFVSGCDNAETISYKIPKETPEVSQPTPESMPASNTGNAMQTLPGMEQAADAAGDLRYTAPEGWEDLPASGMRKANLRINDTHGTAEVTVLAFPGEVGGRLANINRWRGQIGLPPVSADELPAFVQSYEIATHGGLYIRLEGDENSILGALLPFHGYTWFFKLQGNSATVLANETAMKTFLDSIEMAAHAH